MLQVKRLTTTAQIPSRGSPDAAGFDLYADESVTLVPGKVYLVKTGIAVAVQPEHYGRVAPRSSMACKGIFVNGGVIDRDYRGELRIILTNFGESDYKITTGDRIAQLVIERIATPGVLQVAELDDTTRQAGGFGSTGV